MNKLPSSKVPCLIKYSSFEFIAKPLMPTRPIHRSKANKSISKASLQLEAARNYRNLIFKICAQRFDRSMREMDLFRYDLSKSVCYDEFVRAWSVYLMLESTPYYRLLCVSTGRL